MNRIIAILLLLMLSPFYLIISLLVLYEDGIPIHFKQKRIGVDYSIFLLYKFRSMKKNTPNVATHLLGDPSRYLLKTGRVIRKLSLDELPNLLNIIRGEMNFIGPRPALYNQEDLMALRIKVGIHKSKPGITGWAQINGRDDISIEQKVAYEMEYLERKSLWFDTKIIIKTFITVFTGKGVSH